MAEHRVRIFVSSPSDLEHERALVKDIVEQLGQEYLPYFKLHAVLWEEEALTAAQSFQAGLLRPSECEIVLVMLWTRLGTPLADDPYGGMTGTEWEFVDAVATSDAGGPEVLVYQKTAPRMVDITNAEATQVAVEDRQRLEHFFRTHFYNPDGSFRRAFRQFDSDRVLRELVETQLRKLLNRRISAERGAIAGMSDWRESPFRADAPYALRDEPVFVGRETETRELVARLDAVKGPGRGLILVSGPSGAGKSSLIRAGVLPRLVRPFLFAGIAGCRWCLLECAGHDPLESLSQALMAQGLLGPALEAFGLDAPGLTRLFAGNPEVAAGQVCAALEGTAQDPGRRSQGQDGRMQLAIVLDPLDALLAPPALDDPRTQTFAAALSALAARDGVWAIATLRSDRLRELPRLPALAALLDEQTWYRLDPPPAARIRQVMEIPARVAGIEYEDGEGSGRGLVDLLESEASALVHWPALLESTLAALYARALAAPGGPSVDGEAAADSGEGRTPHRLVLALTHYRELGGLRGSVLSRAESLWNGLDADARSALPRLCRALIALEGGPASEPAPRRGDMRTLMRDPDCTRLIQSLIEARLAVAEGIADPFERLPCADSGDGLLDALARNARETRDEWMARLLPGRSADVLARGLGGRAGSPPGPSAGPDAGPGLVAGGAPGDGSASVGPAAATDWQSYRPVAIFAHPDLIRRWGPVRDWLADRDNRRDLQLRFQIARQARLWKRTDCNREYLLGEVGYAGARRFADAYPGELEPLEIDYLERSRRQLIVQRRRNRAGRLVGLTLAGLLAVATGAAFWALDASRKANRSLHLSELNAAERAIDEGNTPEAVRLALEAGPDLPQEATDTLARAVANNRLIAMTQAIGPGPDRPLPPTFRGDGRQLVTLSAREGAILWDLVGDRFVLHERLASPALPIHFARFSENDERALILGVGTSGVWRLPAKDGALPDWDCGGRPGSAVATDRMRRYLAIAHPVPDGRFGICMADLTRPGKLLWDKPFHQREILGIGFNREGTLLVTASRDGSARVIEPVTGEERLVLPPGGPLDRPINRSLFDRQGQRIAIASADERVRLYDLKGRELAVLGEIQRDGRTIRVHDTPVRDIAFASDDGYLLAGDEAGQLVRWNLESGEAVVLGQHRLGVEHVRVSRQQAAGQTEPLVVTASLDKTARLWGLATGKELAVFSHDAAVSGARFTRDGRRVLTYSDLDGSARVWGVAPTSGLAQRLPHDDHVWHLDMARPPKALDPDPAALLLATASFDGTVRVWRDDRSAPGVAPMEIWRLVGHRARVRRVAFSPTARMLASAAYDGTARVWDMVTGGGCALEQGPASEIPTETLQKDQGLGAVPAAPETPPQSPESGVLTEAVRQDPASTVPSAILEKVSAPGAQPEIYRALFAPDEDWLLTASNAADRPVRLWNPRACTELPLPAALGHGSSKVQAAAVTGAAEGIQLVATGDDTGTLRLMRRDPGGDWTLLCRLKVHDAPLVDVAFAPGGGLVATAAEDGKAALVALDGETGGSCGQPRPLDGGADSLLSVAFAPDGASLVTAALDGRAQVWGLDGSMQANLVGHKDRIHYAEFSPDGHWILTASRDGSMRIWQRPAALDPGTGAPPDQGSFLTLPGDSGGVAYARFSPDGRSIGAAYWDNAAILWRLWSADPKPNPVLEAVWGKDRSRLVLIREAERFRRDQGLGDRKGLAGSVE